MRTMQLTIGRVITVRTASMREALALSAPFAYFATNPPQEEAAQRAALAQVAQAVASYVEGCSAQELTEAFNAAPYDMATVLGLVIGSRKGTQRGKPRYR